MSIEMGVSDCVSRVYSMLTYFGADMVPVEEYQQRALSPKYLPHSNFFIFLAFKENRMQCRMRQNERISELHTVK